MQYCNNLNLFLNNKYNKTIIIYFSFNFMWYIYIKQIIIKNEIHFFFTDMYNLHH